jgi:uncharacterized protein
MKLTGSEKLFLIMLSNIHEQLGIQTVIDPKFVKSAINSGNSWGLTWKYPGLDDNYVDPDVVSEVVKILEMWSCIERSYDKLSDEDKASVATTPKFKGFDQNSETEQISVAHFLSHELNRFVLFKDRDICAGIPYSLQMHKRMFAVFEPIMRSSLWDGELSAEQIRGRQMIVSIGLRCCPWRSRSPMGRTQV